MSSRPPNTSSFSSRGRTIPVSEVDRMRAFGANLYNGNNLYNRNSDYHATALPTSYLNSGTQSMPGSNSVPPPLPPRTEVSRYNRYSNYNSFCSPYSRFSPGMYSPAFGGGFGGYRSSYGHYGMPHDSYNSFIQLAEESTRPAFESIESVVDIVGSISMMLESSYHAVYSSYHAILGVVDQFSRLRDHLAEVLSFLALLRGLRYLCLKILYLLRIRKDNPSVEAAWNSARSVSQNSDFPAFSNDKKSPWPFFMFVGLVIGAPWLVFKLLSKSVAKKSFDKSAWSVRGGYHVCTANYDFNTTRRGELPFSAGECLYIAPKNLQGNVPRGWILACNKDNKVGLIPSNYLKLAPSPAGALRVASQVIPDSAANGPQIEETEVVPERSAESSRNATKNPFPKSKNISVNPVAESKSVRANPFAEFKNITVNPFAEDDPVPPEIITTSSIIENDPNSESKE